MVDTRQTDGVVYVIHHLFYPRTGHFQQAVLHPVPGIGPLPVGGIFDETGLYGIGLIQEGGIGRVTGKIVT